jgi:aldehyde dehydrogenase (NAD+)
MALSLLAHRDELGIKHGQLFIEGAWRDAADGEVWTHVHPATAEEIGTFAVASLADVDAAVGAARRAFDEGPWPRARARERVAVLRRIADAVRAHEAELARFIAMDNGIPIGFGALAYPVSVGIVADIFDHHAGWVDKLGGETLGPYQGGEKIVMTLREPVGVVGGVIPWNAPLLLFAQKVAPALAAGCTVVLKPSEYATFSVLRLTQLIEEAGLPPGVLNVVPGPGDPTGEALITHPGVDKLTFTGSRAIGERVMTAAARGVKRVSLELGGKSPLIVFPDAPDVGMAGATAMGMISLGISGQGCVCHTRALVHRDVYDEFLATCEAMAPFTVYGDPFAETTTSAPIINTRQLDRVLGLIDTGQAEGARLVVGGDRPDDAELANGNYVNPTVFADVDNRSTIAQTEVFGPVLAAVPFSDEEEAVRLANETGYGLGATVYTADVRRALRLAKGIRAGTFGVNGYTVEPHAPFGGFKESGLGREGGRAAIESYTELKTVMLPFTDESP